MKKLILTASALLISSAIYALPIEINIPSNNIQLNVEGTVKVDEQSDIVFKFTDSGEVIHLNRESYQNLRGVMDHLYGVSDGSATTNNSTIFISIPETTIEDLNTILNQ